LALIVLHPFAQYGHRQRIQLDGGRFGAEAPPESCGPAKGALYFPVEDGSLNSFRHARPRADR
jgi:hypothetical protein